MKISRKNREKIEQAFSNVIVDLSNVIKDKKISIELKVDGEHLYKVQTC